MGGRTVRSPIAGVYECEHCGRASSDPRGHRYTAVEGMRLDEFMSWFRSQAEFCEMGVDAHLSDIRARVAARRQVGWTLIGNATVRELLELPGENPLRLVCRFWTWLDQRGSTLSEHTQQDLSDD